MVLLGLRQLGDLAPRLQHKLPLVIVTSERPCSRRTCAIRSIEVAADDNSPSVEVNARQRRTEQRGVHEDGEAATPGAHRGEPATAPRVALPSAPRTPLAPRSPPSPSSTRRTGRASTRARRWGAPTGPLRGRVREPDPPIPRSAAGAPGPRAPAGDRIRGQRRALAGGHRPRSAHPQGADSRGAGRDSDLKRGGVRVRSPRDPVPGNLPSREHSAR